MLLIQFYFILLFGVDRKIDGRYRPIPAKAMCARPDWTAYFHGCIRRALERSFTCTPLLYTAISSGKFANVQNFPRVPSQCPISAVSFFIYCIEKMNRRPWLTVDHHARQNRTRPGIPLFEKPCLWRAPFHSWDRAIILMLNVGYCSHTISLWAYQTARWQSAECFDLRPSRES